MLRRDPTSLHWIGMVENDNITTSRTDLLGATLNASLHNILEGNASVLAIGEDRDGQPQWLTGIKALLLGLLMLCTTVGNCFVIAAVWKEQSLQTLTNKLVASLAVTDLLVGLLVMPLAAAVSLLGRWPFGIAVCSIFVTADVLFCTSSILHLVAIAVDRHWAITDVTYNRGSKLHKYMVPISIVGCWFLSAAICLPPFFGWKTEQQRGDCIISQDKGYTVYSTVGAFYLPLIVIIGIYIRIFLVVRARVRRKAFAKQPSHSPSPLPQLRSRNSPEVTASHTMVTIVTEETLLENGHQSSDSQSSMEPAKFECDEEEDHIQQTQTLTIPGNTEHHKKRLSVQQIINNIPLLSKKKTERSKENKLAVKRERKAFRTLAIITGIFVTCWLPFFLVALVRPFICPSPSDECSIPLWVVDFVTWLGYVNCMLNPIIYNIFNPDFRAAFKKILLRKCQ